MTYSGRRRDPLGGAALARFGFADLDKAARLLGDPGMIAVADSPTAMADFQVAADPDLALLTLSRLVDLGEPTAGLAPTFVADAEFRRRFLRIIVIGLIGLASDLLFKWVNRRAFPWAQLGR